MARMSLFYYGVRRFSEVLATAGALALLVMGSSSQAKTSSKTFDLSTAAICDRAAGMAAQKSGVPVQVLRAIALTETGRKGATGFAPWPWTVNLEGRGFWFPTRGEAEQFVAKHHAQGARSYDVGCFQINYKWHGGAFASPIAMFDPDAGAAYAAGFLSDLYDEFGSWSLAAGAYHSRTPSLASKYRARFDRLLARIESEAAPPTVIASQSGSPSFAPPIQITRRENRFPLLAPGVAYGSAGSLFATPSNGVQPFLALGAPVAGLWDE